MASIALYPGLSFSNLPKTTTRLYIDRGALLDRLGEIRREWQTATGDLSRVTCDLGAIFDELEGAIIGGHHDR